jgi:hypothetical protein
MDVDAAVEEMVYQYVSGVMDVDAVVENRTSLEFRFVSITGTDAWDVAMARYLFHESGHVRSVALCSPCRADYCGFPKMETT